MNRPSKAAVLAGWGIALAGCAATIWIGMNVIAAQAISGLLGIFQAPGAASAPPSNSALIWPLVPAVAAVAINSWMLWFRPAQPNGISGWWLVPALAITVGTLLLGIWVCIDIWPSQPGAAA